MTLRLRLVLALVVLVTAGLAVFGAATYTLYRRSQYQQLDNQIISIKDLVDRQLDLDNHLTESGPGGGPPGVVAAAPPGTYGEMRDPNGNVIGLPILYGNYPAGDNPPLPKLPAHLPAPSNQLFNVSATRGSGGYRCLVAATPGGGVVVVAEPTTSVTNALHQLTLIEVSGALILLLLLSSGAWLILRRGLRPLERMAGTARSIATGELDLSQRVSPSGGPNEVGELGLALNTMLDDIEAAFKERDETEHRLRQFLADASHELRTPLTSIQGFAELFRVGGENARVDLPTILRRIEEESARMKLLVEDLLLLARLDQTRAVERAPVDLAVLASDACSDAVATAPERMITLDAPEPVVLAGVEAHLRQAIANLLTNAVKHTPSGTPIEVGAVLSDGEAVVSVRDHGAGLGEVELAHVFDRFWQADRARVGTGAGLGLAIVASIAAEHGGRASAANAPGGGALFVLRLPISAPVPDPRMRQIPGGMEEAPSRL